MLRRWRRIDVEAVHLHLGVVAGEADTGPPQPTAQIGNSGPRFGQQPAVDVGQPLREPLAGEKLEKGGPVERALPVSVLRVVVGVVHAAPGPVRLNELVEGLGRAHDEIAEGDPVGEAFGVDQHFHVGVGQTVGAFVRLGRRGVHMHEPGDGLLFEPFPRVAGGDAGHLR